MSKDLRIGVGTLRETAGRFVTAWKRGERGDIVERLELTTFEDMETFLAVMTSTRWALLRALRAKGPMNVRALAKALARDYENVHNDVGILANAGLIDRSSGGRVLVPWDTLLAELDLKAA